MLPSLRDTRWSETALPPGVQIGLATFGILALELAIIRWMAGQIRLFAYFSNLVLIGCFLGMGVGVAAGRQWPGLVHFALPALATLAVPLGLAEPLLLVNVSFPDTTLVLWGGGGGAGTAYAVRAYGLVLGLFGLVVVVFVCAGTAVGHLFARLPNLRAYSADLVGSLMGVLAMTALTAVEATPPFWLLLGGLPFLVLSRSATSLVSLAVAVGLGAVSVGGAAYSPYNRIDLDRSEFGLTLHVNRDFHQYMHDLSEASAHPLKKPVRDMYDVPFVLGERRGRALVIGAGTGNDVQAALRSGFRSVTSVDIDGRIIDFGRRLHPERPYQDPRVEAVVNDARAFFEQRREGFDVVCFGLVDSHAMFSALSTLRLDNYLYTEQGLRSAWRLVAPEGLLTVNLSFAGGKWMLDRLYWTLARATNQPPLVVAHGLHEALTLVVSRDPDRLRWDRVPFPRGPLSPDSGRGVRTTSDDWPFLYLRPAVVPWGYALVLAGVLALAAGLTLKGLEARPFRAPGDRALFFMGAAFLLVETRGVTSLSLLFGSTWVVNASVFGGILVMALAANLVVERRGAPAGLAPFVALLVSLLVLWAVDVSALNRLPLVARGIVGGLLNAAPVASAGVLVSSLLARSTRISDSLASNLLGSVLGGCLEYLCVYTGLRALVLLALVLYLAAFLCLARGFGRPPGPPGAPP